MHFEDNRMGHIFKMVRASMKSVLQGLGVISIWLMTGGVNAHHSTASFDNTKVIELKGEVKEFQWTNPHTWIQLNVTDAEGNVVEWSIEGGSPGSLSRNGWKASTFKTGDLVTIKARPMLNGNPGGAFMGATLADGKTIGNW
jgi:hypothetical protein